MGVLDCTVYHTHKKLQTLQNARIDSILKLPLLQKKLKLINYNQFNEQSEYHINLPHHIYHPFKEEYPCQMSMDELISVILFKTALTHM